jgi:hypothetical protein
MFAMATLMDGVASAVPGDRWVLNETTALTIIEASSLMFGRK